ncbi:SigE family RNA polymerase sigma factor [Promicromonospora sp. Populi]|uniref:SigE family RNA polymerase sigma factor n=1 Tax=Promicromonospora sp. Populi TaxID=3239420 RepID=UPI0034E1EF8F
MPAVVGGMTHESGATVSNLWTDRPSDGEEVREVQVSVPRTRDAEFTAFVRDSGAYLHRTAYLLCGDPHRAEELVQSTFERVYRTWAKVRPGTQRAYARRILVNLRIDGWRHGHRESFPGDDKIPVATTSDHAGQVVLRDELVRGLAQLPISQRRVVVLRHLLDLPEAEVARELGLAIGTVKAANSRGLARLRDLLRAGAEAIEPVAFDEQVVLDRSRAALRRRRVGQALGAACVVLLLALGVVTRGPVPLPVVGPVVLPGGQLIAPLFDGGRTEGVGPDPISAGNTPIPCPAEVPAATPTREAEPGEDLGPLFDPVVANLPDARPLTCYDVDIEAVARGSLDEDEDLPYLGGLSDTGDIWDGVVRTGPDSIVEEAALRMGGYRGDEPAESIPTDEIDGVPMWPLDPAARGSRVLWLETPGGAATPLSRLRTVEVGGEAETLITLEESVWDLAVTDENALWTAGVTDEDKSLFTTTLDEPGTPTELADNVQALAADGDEVVVAASGPGSSLATTSILGFRGSTLLFELEVEHGPSAEVTEVAISDNVVAWTVAPTIAESGASNLYVVDRVEGRESIVHLADDVDVEGGVQDLRAAGGLLLWNRIDDVGSNPTFLSYLYRATPSASGSDGPDLIQLPGEAVTANLAGDRIAWLESQDRREWLVEGTVTPTLDRD